MRFPQHLNPIHEVEFKVGIGIECFFFLLFSFEGNCTRINSKETSHGSAVIQYDHVIQYSNASYYLRESIVYTANPTYLKTRQPISNHHQSSTTKV